MEENCRKRSRPDDSEIFSQQKKILVNQQLLDMHNEEKMKQIYGKTVNLLFKGMKNLATNDGDINDKNFIMKNVRLSGNGIVIQHKNESKILNTQKECKKSKCCNKIAVINSDCKNCNLNLCEFCGYSCTGCGIFLCGACISLFGCGTIDEPLCSTCKMFNS